jgi:F-type H+-transporting ATPase subunit epsilon
MDNYLVDILTPDRVIAKDISAKNISVSTIKGEVNVLANHTHFITNLLTGLLTVRGIDGDLNFTVENGICKILGNKITILSSSSLTKSDVDLTKAEEEVNSITKKLNKTDLMSDDSINELYKRLEVLDSQIKLGNI